MYEEANYQPNNMININYINSLENLSKSLIDGLVKIILVVNIKALSFAWSEIKLQERRERRDSKGNVQVYYVDYFNDNFIFVFEKEFKERLQIMEKELTVKFLVV